MYRTCIYCHSDLRTNRSLEQLPIGRTLAFDGSKGRLWVICERCRRWNLTPVEERWEAIEECERRFHDTARTFSTENIGLAELRDDVHLVRIGTPKRRELAAWRYGRELWRRRVRHVVRTTAWVGAAGMSLVSALLTGANVFSLAQLFLHKRTALRVTDSRGRRYHFLSGVPGAKLIREDEPPGWHLLLPYYPSERRRVLLRRVSGEPQSAKLMGEDAIYMAGRVLPMINSFGGNDAQVQAAVEYVERSDTVEDVFHRASERPHTYRPDRWFDPSRSTIRNMDPEVRIALEMAAHEETERRALCGELALLEDAWREAEEVAAIADRLLIPAAIERKIAEWQAERDQPRTTS